MYEFLSSNKTWQSIENAGNLASVAASYLVEQKGPQGFQAKEKVLERYHKHEYISDLE